MLQKVKSAIADNRVLMYFQPIMCLKTNLIYKYELLARIDTLDKIAFPHEFLSHMDYDTYSDFTQNILLKTIEFLSETSNITVSINISTKDIENKITSAHIINSLKETQLSTRERLIIEIVETDDISCPINYKVFLRDLKDLGVKIALDDFGSGFCNFDRILQSDFDYLKIDGEIIRQLSNPKSRSIVELISHFSKEYGITVIAEQVEDAKTLDELKKLNIDYIQGYYIGHPSEVIPANRVIKWGYNSNYDQQEKKC